MNVLELMIVTHPGEMSSKLIRFYNFHFLLPRNFGNNDIIVNRVRFQRALYSSLRKQPTFSDATNGFPAK